MYHCNYHDTCTTAALLWDVLSSYFGLKLCITGLDHFSYSDITTKLHIMKHLAK